MDSDSALANILEVLVPMVALAILATAVVISALKRRLWFGLLGLFGLVGGFRSRLRHVRYFGGFR